MSSDQSTGLSSNNSSDAAHFGYIDRDRLGRTTIYTTVSIHGDTSKRYCPTYFLKSAGGEIYARSAIVGQLAVDVIAAIVDDIDKPFAPFRGVWVSASDNLDFESMVVFFKKADSMMDTITWSIAQVLHPDATATLTRRLD
jgi:hypothetical protein